MNNPMPNITHCVRCGTCCLKGGPVLHHDDKKILLAGHIGYEHLCTIRKGEPAYNPVLGKLERVTREIIIISGKDDELCCRFYRGSDASCSVYEHRFLECRLLKCWDTAEIMRIIGRGTIVRSDIINRNDPIMEMIEAHEKECPVQEAEDLIAASFAAGYRKKILARLGELVARDVAIRAYAISELGLRAEYELFIFGRPLSKLLGDRGLAVRNSGENISIAS